MAFEKVPSAGESSNVLMRKGGAAEKGKPGKRDREGHWVNASSSSSLPDSLGATESFRWGIQIVLHLNILKGFASKKRWEERGNFLLPLPLTQKIFSNCTTPELNCGTPEHRGVAEERSTKSPSHCWVPTQISYISPSTGGEARTVGPSSFSQQSF